MVKSDRGKFDFPCQNSSEKVGGRQLMMRIAISEKWLNLFGYESFRKLDKYVNVYSPTKRWETLTKLKGKPFHSAKNETKIVEKSQVVLFRIFEKEKKGGDERFREREEKKKLENCCEK